VCSSDLLAEPADELAGQKRGRRLVFRIDRWRVRHVDFGLAFGGTMDVGTAGTGLDALSAQPGQPLLLMFGQGDRKSVGEGEWG